MGDEQATERALTFQVTADAMRVLVSGRLPDGDPASAVAELAAALRERGLANLPDQEALLGLVRGATGPGGEVRDLEVTRGRPAEPSVDGNVIWTRDFFADGFVEDAAGGVDFWQRRGNPSIGVNEVIATLVEPQKGADGQDVFGTKLPAAAPAPLRLRAGANVRVEPREAGRSALVATLDGRLRIASGAVTVDNVYTINGNVGLETGHIIHRGAVVVKGDLEPGSRIDAGGDCEIRGTVERAVLNVGGNLVVHGGLVGRGDAPCVVKGQMHAKYVLDAEVEVGEAMVIESEITHSIVRCRGAVEVPRGRIVSGDVAALGGVIAGVAGGEGLSRTVITAGLDHRWDAEVAAREEEARGHERNRTRIQSTVRPLLEREKSLTPQQREAATELLARAAEMETTIAELTRAAEHFAADSRARAVSRVLVLQRAHADTVFVLPEGRLVLDEEREGPFRARFVRGRVMALPGERDAGGEGEEAGSGEGGAAAPSSGGEAVRAPGERTGRPQPTERKPT
ncbi:MAG: FapA family protein [Candidatus Krumholzibacteriia bacterium]